MEPIEILLHAIAQGGPALRPHADPSLRRAYTDYVELLAQKYGSDQPSLLPLIRDYVHSPEWYETPLSSLLGVVGADRDRDLLSRARQVLRASTEAYDEPGTGQTKSIFGRDRDLDFSGDLYDEIESTRRGYTRELAGQDDTPNRRDD